MSLLQAIILGVVQGLTEFLPVSSSAHLVLLPWFFKWNDPGLAYDVALHWGTLIGVIAYFWKDLWDLARGWFGSLQGQREFSNQLPWFLIIGTIPGALSGFLLEKQAETIFRSPGLIAANLVVLGLVLLWADRRPGEKLSFNQVSMKAMLLIGLSQALAIVPGISRSGITISVALLLGFERTAAVRLSFLLSVPIIAGAGLLKFRYLLENLSSPLFLTGVVSAAVSGFLAILFLMTFVKTKRFTPFVVYRFLLAALILLNMLILSA